MGDIRKGELTGVEFEAFNSDSHASALRAAGYEPAPAQVGDRVLVSLDNGYEDFGVVRRIFKNGGRRVHEERGRSGNRSRRDLWQKVVGHL